MTLFGEPFGNYHIFQSCHCMMKPIRQYVPFGCSYIVVRARNNGVAVHISVELNLLFLSYNLSRHGSLFFILESETIVFMALIIWTLWFVCLPRECITMTFDTLPIGGHIR